MATTPQERVQNSNAGSVGDIDSEDKVALTALPSRPTADATRDDSPVTMYTDGSCLCDGHTLTAGSGVWFGTKSPHNIRARVPGQQTNNRAELNAIIQALRKAHAVWPTRAIHIYCDSILCVKGINEWRAGWKASGWRTSARRTVSNLDLWKTLDAELTAVCENVEVKVVHVSAHVGIKGNEEADKLAKEAAGGGTDMAQLE